MGNSVTHGGRSEGKVKVILADGKVCEYEEALTVAEMMLEHPQQVVVEFHQAVADGKKAAPLPADKKLEMNKVYLMLPIRRGGKAAVLSKEEARQLLLKTDAVLKSKLLLCHYTGFVPLFARMCPATAASAGVALNEKNNIGISYLEEEEEEEEGSNKQWDYFSEILEGRPEYLSMSRQLSGKGWKPNLDTIKEKNIKTKVRHWLF